MISSKNTVINKLLAIVVQVTDIILTQGCFEGTRAWRICVALKCPFTHVSSCSGGQDAGGFRVQGQRWAKKKWTKLYVYILKGYMFYILYIILFYIFYYSLLFSLSLCPSLFLSRYLRSFKGVGWLSEGDTAMLKLMRNKISKMRNTEKPIKTNSKIEKQWDTPSLSVSLQSLCRPSLSVLGALGARYPWNLIGYWRGLQPRSMVVATVTMLLGRQTSKHQSCGRIEKDRESLGFNII